MGTITGLTAERMQEIIDERIVDADIVGNNLILEKEDGSTIDAGAVVAGVVGGDILTGLGNFRAFRNAAVSLASGGVILFDGESWDISGWYDPATGKFQPQDPCIVELTAVVTSNALLTADKFWNASIENAGGDVIIGSRTFQRGAAGGPVSVATGQLQANGTTDFFRVKIAHDNGGTVAIQNGFAYTFFTGRVVAVL